MHVSTRLLPASKDEDHITRGVRRIEADYRAGRADHERTTHLLLRVAERTDRTTAAHVHRVGSLAAMIARRLGWTDPDAAALATAGALHDVGKVALPPELLQLPRSLTPAEHAIVRLHTRVASRILQEVTHPLLLLAREVSTGHHEWWDGAGYPSGISGEAIPLSARIVAVADVWDALTSDRPYRPAMPACEALQILQAGEGTQFDPAVFAAFMAEWPTFAAAAAA